MWNQGLLLSLAAHLAFAAWLGLSITPERPVKPGPMVMWLATVEQEPGARSQEPEGLQKPSTPSVEPKKAQNELSEAVSQPLIDEPVIKKVETQIADPAVEEKQTPEMPLESETVVEDILRPDQEMNQSPELITVAAKSGSTRIYPDARHQTLDTSLLAFVGDPVAAGIIPVSDGGGLLTAAILSLPEPTYPALSRKRGEEGRVVVKIKVSAMGEVRSAELHSSSSYPRLDRAALAAVERARFSPATEYGRLVESERVVAYRFELEGR